MGVGLFLVLVCITPYFWIVHNLSILQLLVIFIICGIIFEFIFYLLTCTGFVLDTGFSYIHCLLISVSGGLFW